MAKNIYKDVLFGLAIGDALGVPVEFKSRKMILQNPVTDMKGFGTHNMPAGTFSDDSSLAFCLAEVLTQDFSLVKIADNFSSWLNHNYWTATGHVFDIGMATREAIKRIDKSITPELAGGTDEQDNGNGSLMRILPLIFYTRDKTIEARYQLTKLVSSITHGHIRAVIACFYYLEFAKQLIEGNNKFEVYKNLKTLVIEYLVKLSVNSKEINLFDRLLKGNIYELKEENIYSSGYVLHTLEASIWCLLTTNDYKSATLKAVNLGLDTDTTGAVTGGLAGILYGFETIPHTWLEKLARRKDIEDLAERLEKVYNT